MRQDLPAEMSLRECPSPEGTAGLVRGQEGQALRMVGGRQGNNANKTSRNVEKEAVAW